MVSEYSSFCHSLSVVSCLQPSQLTQQHDSQELLDPSLLNILESFFWSLNARANTRMLRIYSVKPVGESLLYINCFMQNFFQQLCRTVDLRHPGMSLCLISSQLLWLLTFTDTERNIRTCVQDVGDVASVVALEYLEDCLVEQWWHRGCGVGQILSLDVWMDETHPVDSLSIY